MDNRNIKFNEEELIKIAKPYFNTARSGDWEHALRVVKWIKELGKDRSNLHLLVVAGYIHDIGWSGVAPEGKLDLDVVLELEHKANKNSPKFIREVLEKLKFAEDEIQTVNKFVKAADKHESVDDDEAIIVDSDALSKLNPEHLREKYNLESFGKALQYLETKIPGRLKTKKAKVLFSELFPKLKAELM
ncbi:HD domain-containing protein [bacterium]|jgi:HD superfamily phosphodiesterase|nr:HD domain-containing protein [bacterium]MBT3730112.1 HD domain-containing protein [bacterium]MBT4894697.1 HD domain-containing protein [bacterium]